MSNSNAINDPDRRNDAGNDHPPRWDLGEVRNLAERLAGRGATVGPSAQSTWFRMEYARHHLHESDRLLSRYVDEHIARHGILIAARNGSDREAREAFEVLMIEAGAEILACVQGIHAVADLMANTVYHALEMDKRPDALKPWRIHHDRVLHRLSNTPDVQASLIKPFGALGSGGSFDHINALANSGKHISIIRPSLSEDWTGTRPVRHGFKLPPFDYHGAPFGEVYVNDLLEAEFDRCNRALVDAGVALNALLRARVAARFGP